MSDDFNLYVPLAVSIILFITLFFIMYKKDIIEMFGIKFIPVLLLVVFFAIALSIPMGFWVVNQNF